MMHLLKTTLSICIFLFMHKSNSALTIHDSIPATQKLNKAQFLEKYKYDDTAKSIIEVFYKAKKKNKKTGFVFIGIGTLSAGISLLLIVLFGIYSILFGVFFFLPLAFIAFPISLIAFIFHWYRYSQKNLYRILHKYETTRTIPKWIKRKLKFTNHV